MNDDNEQHWGQNPTEPSGPIGGIESEKLEVLKSCRDNLITIRKWVVFWSILGIVLVIIAVAIAVLASLFSLT